jgi:hypothetical protein
MRIGFRLSPYFAMVMLVVYSPDHGSLNNIVFSRAEFSHLIIPGQAVKQ